MRNMALYLKTDIILFFPNFCMLKTLPLGDLYGSLYTVHCTLSVLECQSQTDCCLARYRASTFVTQTLTVTDVVACTSRRPLSSV